MYEYYAFSLNHRSSLYNILGIHHQNYQTKEGRGENWENSQALVYNHLNILINNLDQQIITGKFFYIAYTFPPSKANMLRLGLLVCSIAKPDFSRNLPEALILDP
jgi:hypothetical protein